MKNFSLGYLALLAIWWGSLLTTWVVITGAASGRLNAPALSAALGALPVVLLLTLFLILYTSFRKSLLLLAVGGYLFGAWLSLQPVTQQLAVVNLIATQTGIADAAGQSALATVNQTVWPAVSTAVAFIAAGYSLIWVFRASSIASRERKVSDLPEDDLWRETSVD